MASFPENHRRPQGASSRTRYPQRPFPKGGFSPAGAGGGRLHCHWHCDDEVLNHPRCGLLSSLKRNNMAARIVLLLLAFSVAVKSVNVLLQERYDATQGPLDMALSDERTLVCDIVYV